MSLAESVVELDDAVIAVPGLRRRRLLRTGLIIGQQVRGPKNRGQLRCRRIGRNPRSGKQSIRSIAVVSVRRVTGVSSCDIELLLFEVRKPEGMVFPERAA